MNPRSRLALLPLLLLASACSMADPSDPGGGPGPGGGSGTPGAYVVQGRVTTSAGQPLPGVAVFADNTAGYNANVYGVTGADGRYRIDLAGLTPDTWRIGAYVEATYHGRRYEFGLVPDDPAPFNAAPGVTRNLTWRLSGPDPEGGLLGATVYLYPDLTRIDGTFDPDHVAFTLTPDGPLVDGSAGSPISGTGLQLDDVPVGRYTVTAHYAAPGEAARALLVRVRSAGPYAASATALFTPDTAYGTILEIELATRPD